MPPHEITAALIGAALCAIGWLIARVFDKDKPIKLLSDRVGAIELKQVRFETFLDLMGKNLAIALHSPTTPDFDFLAEKYSQNHELTWDEWQAFREICLGLAKDDSPHPNKISGYAVLAALCEHKLMLPGIPTGQK